MTLAALIKKGGLSDIATRNVAKVATVAVAGHQTHESDSRPKATPERVESDQKSAISNPLVVGSAAIEPNSLLATTDVRGERVATATIATVATLPVFEKDGGPLACDEDPNALPYMDDRGELIIPTDCPKKYRWWQGGQSVESTIAELRKKKADGEPKEGETLSDDFRHLLNLVRALRLAQKSNLAVGKRPDMAEAKRLETAVDHFIS